MLPGTRQAGLAVYLFVSLLPISAAAHHSDAGLDLDSVVVLDGTVTTFNWRNPHVYFTIQALGEGGRLDEWELQTVAIPIMVRSGWDRDSVSVGDRVIVRGHPALDGRKYAMLLSVDKNGEILLPVRAAETSGASPSAETLAGVWRGDRASIGGFTEFFDRLVLTEKAVAARDAFDVFSTSNPVTACTARPTPATVVSAGLYLSEIEFGDDTVLLRNEIFDVERVVYTDGRGHPLDGERTVQGHSVGRWEGDVFIVDTRQFSDHRSPYQNGVPSGAQKHVAERYHLTSDGTRLEIEVFLEDPEYLAEPLISTMEWIYAPEGDLLRFDCDAESTRHFIPGV